MRSDAMSIQMPEARAHLHAMWASVAHSWERHAAYSDARGAGAAAGMLELTTPHRGERVLELACGPGGLGLAAAARVAPDGEVVLSDVAAEMTAIARARAEALALDNVSVAQLDFESIAEPDRSYDVVLCREGLMFALDPARAAAEIRRVLRPGGRVALAVWGPRERNPWLGLVLDAVSAQMGTPIPPAGVPGPFSLSDAACLAALLTDAGLDGVTVAECPAPLHADTVDEWWERTSALAGPLARLLASMSPDGARELRTRAAEAVAPYEGPGGLDFPGVTLIASARRD
jgi:ubiquinone/menaquinone biosynthesis C-methylase UbiE